jgi:phenylpropionate dioxygenase-like ring-hydroxylating dioxygenase large terminal subunit
MVQTTLNVSFDIPDADEGNNPVSVDPAAPVTARIDKNRYISHQWLEQERDKLWPRTWLFAGLESDLENTGDFISFEIGAESILIVRDKAGDIGAFYNACQHRGNRIVTETNGTMRHIRCPYHGWTYGFDGALKGVPSRKRFSPEPGADTHSLKPVRVESLHGLVWVNMDNDAMPLEHYLGVLGDIIAPYNLQRMVLVSQQCLELDANWKTARDNFLEQYHVDFIHPQHADIVDCENSVNTLFPFGHSMTSVKGFVTDEKYAVPDEAPYYLAPLLNGLDLDIDSFKGRVADIRKAVQQQKRKISQHLQFDYGELSDDELTDVIQLDIFPNLFITIQAEEVSLYTPRPHHSDPDKCFFDKWTLQIPSELGSDPATGWALSPALATSKDDPRPQKETFDRDAVIKEQKSLALTFDQDIFYLPDMQAGMHSRGFDTLTLNVDEVRIQHFHNWLDSYMR